MTRSQILIAALAATAMSAGNVHAQEDAVAMGKAFALETCTSCQVRALFF